MEAYERSLGLEEELRRIGIKVAMDVLTRAGFEVREFPDTEEEASKISGFLDYFKRVEEIGSRPEIVALKDERVFVISIDVNESGVFGLKRRALNIAREHNLIPMIFRTNIELSIPSSTLEFLRD